MVPSPKDCEAERDMSSGLRASEGFDQRKKLTIACTMEQRACSVHVHCTVTLTEEEEVSYRETCRKGRTDQFPNASFEDCHCDNVTSSTGLLYFFDRLFVTRPPGRRTEQFGPPGHGHAGPMNTVTQISCKPQNKVSALKTSFFLPAAANYPC